MFIEFLFFEVMCSAVDVRNESEHLIDCLINFQLKAPVDGSCVDDQFIVAGQSPNNLIPILCGINTGQHSKIRIIFDWPVEI